MSRRRTPISVMLLIVAAAAACSGDDDSAGDGSAGDQTTPQGGETAGNTTASDASGSEAGTATDVDPCTLLTIDEIETEFGTAGEVSDGEGTLGQDCGWDVGEDQSQPGTGTVHVFVQYIDPALPIDDAATMFADQQQAAAGAVEIDGLGDAAYYQPDLTTVNMLVGDRVTFVQAAFIPTPDGVQESLETLAALVVDRL
jgi:hypothetical protein